MKSFMDELTGYRVKVERDGKELLNVPGILALPAALIAPKASIIGTIAASLLGCSIHLEGSDGKEVDVSEKVRKTAETVAETAGNVAKTVREEVEKAWESVSADSGSDFSAAETELTVPTTKRAVSISASARLHNLLNRELC